MSAEQTPDIAALDAALRLISPDHITPMGKRVVRQALAPVLAAAWDAGYEQRAASLGMDADPNPYRADRITEPVSHEAATSGEEASKA